MEIPGGLGVHKWPSGREIPRGWGIKTKEPSVGGGGGGMDIFWHHTICFVYNNLMSNLTILQSVLFHFTNPILEVRVELPW